jgi:hypothetical protein
VVEVGANARKVDPGDTEVGCPVRRGRDGVWQVRGYPAGRAVLRSTGTVQAGLGIETVEKLPSKIRRPVLYRDGPEHREHRRQTAQYFTPRRVGLPRRDGVRCRRAGREAATGGEVEREPVRLDHRGHTGTSSTFTRHLAGRATRGRGDRPHPRSRAPRHPHKRAHILLSTPTMSPTRSPVASPCPTTTIQRTGGSERGLQVLDPDAGQPVGMLHHDRGDLWRSRSSRASPGRRPFIGGPDPRHDLVHPNALPDTRCAHPPGLCLSDPAASRARTPAHTPRPDPNCPPRADQPRPSRTEWTHVYSHFR